MRVIKIKLQQRRNKPRANVILTAASFEEFEIGDFFKLDFEKTLNLVITGIEYGNESDEIIYTLKTLAAVNKIDRNLYFDHNLRKITDERIINLLRFKQTL